MDIRPRTQEFGFSEPCNFPESKGEYVSLTTKSFLITKPTGCGFGFTVTGYKPVKIKTVREGSKAHTAGLCTDDQVIAVNGQNVSSWLAANVAKLVRQTTRELVIEIQRENSRDETGDETMEWPEMGSCISEVSFNERTSLSSRITGDQRKPSNIHPEQTMPKALFAINNLIQCENQFLQEMQIGIQRYAEPLRQNLISPADHFTLFQNLDRLMENANLLLNKIEQAERCCTGKDGINQERRSMIIGSIYLSNLPEITDLFINYCNNIKSAFRLLAELTQFQEFEEFIITARHNSFNLMTIHEFIKKPLEHIKDLFINFQNILAVTPAHHAENISKVVDGLRDACNKVNNNNTRKSTSMTSLSSSSSSSSQRSRSFARKTGFSTSISGPSMLSLDSSRSSHGSGSASSCYSSGSSSCSVESSLDPEVLDIQRRLVFGKNSPVFQLATATRHLIYAGELNHTELGSLYIVLLSDLLLLTQPQPDHRLLVVDKPILLTDIKRADFNTDTSLDFSITVQSAREDVGVDTFMFSSPSVALKHTWVTLLDQRIRSSKIQWNFLGEDSFV